MLDTVPISGKLIGDFIVYEKTIVDLIGSAAPEPNYTIGVYGDWGTGKTTLMRQAHEDLQKKGRNIVSVWFDAWLYEREKEFALIPLLNTMANELANKGYNRLSETFKTLGLSLLTISPDIVSLLVPGGGILKPIIDVASKGGSEYIKSKSNTRDKASGTIYYEGLEKIKNEIGKLRKKREFRIIVFVDDLDRCSPSKMLEVFESTKVLLNISGFIFVVGISYNVIVESIEKTENLDDGNEYLKKIVDIPIFLPAWEDESLNRLIDLSSEELSKNDKVGKLPTDDLKDLIKDMRVKELIKEISECNPREIKRFIRILVFSYGIMEGFIQEYSDKGSLRNLLMHDILMIFVTLQGMNFKWNDLYNLVLYADEIKRNKFLEAIKKYSKHPKFYKLLTIKEFDTPKKKVRKIIKKYDKDEDFKEFLRNHRETLCNISSNQWTYLQRISRTSSFSSSQIPMDNVAPQGGGKKKLFIEKLNPIGWIRTIGKRVMRNESRIE
jgi:hypothetical protein